MRFPQCLRADLDEGGMDSELMAASLPGVAAGDQPAAIPHPLIQYGHMIVDKATLFQNRPRLGYRRGIDCYSAASLPTVISLAAEQFHYTHERFPNLILPERYSDKIFWSK